MSCLRPPQNSPFIAGPSGRISSSPGEEAQHHSAEAHGAPVDCPPGRPAKVTLIHSCARQPSHVNIFTKHCAEHVHVQLHARQAELLTTMIRT